jgi:ribosomal protein L1
MAVDELYANMGALTSALLAVKPDAVKGSLPKYVKKVDLASSMGRGVPVEPSSLMAAMDAAKAASGP